ncbi:TadE/TadG family type IV pilus assembly protein [Campylobacter sp. 19-13652]|uniref:TadE/TadG family type IV pilus assembly protein n=1 Tax=Campylobacter sp. 19-13652 TaxID=2840180 RepID=UPI001C75FB76|nr:tight adherence pilus pseudopilin TadF [Campylobacter sp. 19-13652]BCX78547.1 hypothetical protein LBC_00090 [Campylobacter sp. 19-13652]
MKKFILNKTASVSVEASIVFLGLVVILAGIADAGYVMVNKSRLERLSYSFLGILRQNDLEITKNNKIDKDLADGLYQSALNLSKGYIKDTQSLGMVIEHFEFDKSAKPKLKQSLNYGKSCQNSDSIDAIATPKSKESYLDVYRVSFCFDSFLPSSKKLLGLKASAAGVVK